jgi:hypothetical protein
MKIVKYKCGCIKISGEDIYLHYCEGDGNEYGIYLNDRRTCEGLPETITGSERYAILRTLQQQVSKGYRYDELRQSLKSFLNDTIF